MWFVFLWLAALLILLVLFLVVGLATWCGAEEDLKDAVRKHLFRVKD